VKRNNNDGPVFRVRIETTMSAEKKLGIRPRKTGCCGYHSRKERNTAVTNAQTNTTTRTFLAKDERKGG